MRPTMKGAGGAKQGPANRGDLIIAAGRPRRLRRGRGASSRRSRQSHGGGASAPVCWRSRGSRSEEHTSELQSLAYLVCRLLVEKKHTSELQSLAYLVCRLLLEKKKNKTRVMPQPT